MAIGRNNHSCKQCGAEYPGHIQVQIHTHVGLKFPLSREQTQKLQKHATDAANAAILQWLDDFERLTKRQGR